MPFDQAGLPWSGEGEGHVGFPSCPIVPLPTPKYLPLNIRFSSQGFFNHELVNHCSPSDWIKTLICDCDIRLENPRTGTNTIFFSSALELLLVIA